MENVVENQIQTETVYSNEWYKIIIPLTGNYMPFEFKMFVADSVSGHIKRLIVDKPFTNGVTHITKTDLTGSLFLTLTLNSDGTFTDTFELRYCCTDPINRNKYENCRIFHAYDIGMCYIVTYRKKALRKLKKLCRKGLNKMRCDSVSTE